MANWNNNDGFRQQKKRNFIYKSVPHNKNIVQNPQNSQRNLTATHMIAPTSTCSPRKKRRSSYGFYDKSTTDQQAAEELCSDLPADAFEDDDFGDDFSVEELCEAASVAEQAASVSKDRQTSSNVGPVVDVKYTSTGFNEDYFDGIDQDIGLVETEELVRNNISTSHIPFSSKSNGNKSDFSTEKTAVLFSAGSNSSNPSHGISTGFNKTERFGNNVSITNRSTEELKILEDKLKKCEKRVRDLEEQNYEKDGNLKMLQDSLSHLKSEETKHREKFKKLEDESNVQMKELKRNYEKRVEQLNSKICFQEQEIKQAKEQRQARLNHSIDNARESPKTSKSHSKTSQDKSNIPTGQSFFEKSPKTPSKAPKVKHPKPQKSPENKPELSKPSTSKEQLSNRKLEKELLRSKQVVSQKYNVKVVQKLFKLPNTELTNTCFRYEASPYNQSLLALVRLVSSASQTDLTKRDSGIEVERELSEEDVLKNSVLNSQHDSEEIKQAINSLQELLDNEQSKSQTHTSYLPLVPNFKSSNLLGSTQPLNSLTSLLPLLHHHISQYIELCTEQEDESLTSTWSSGYLGDLPEVKDKDVVSGFSLALDSAIQSLRCLDVLICYSAEVCELLLKTFKTQPNEEEKEEVGTVQHDTSVTSTAPQSFQSDLLSLVFQLVIPHSNESSLVNLVSLGVVRSLAEKCPQEHGTWYYPLLCNSLLPQCLSKEFGVDTLSLVIHILSRSLDCGQHICSQSDYCLLIKIYQSCLDDSTDLPHSKRISLQLKVITLVESILSSSCEALPYMADCCCCLELLKHLVCVLDKEVVFLQHFPVESLMSSPKTSLCLLLVRRGIFLLGNLLTFSNRLLADLQVLVGHKYHNVIISAQRLLHDVKNLPDNEELILQDLLDIEHIEESEVLGDHDEDEVEDMEVCH